METYEITRLWASSLGERDDDTHRRERNNLRSAYYQFRENVRVLVSRIQSSAPNLTVHDVSHLDRLWETASLIAGPGYPLNPMEAFVFGGAVLLHDSALCFEAYDGGLKGIRSTIAWSDAYAYEISCNQDVHTANANADFTALRQLHADQAEKLVERSWKNVDNGSDFYLLENTGLRNHVGQLIGRIAASHHWTIEKVSSTFSRQLNAMADYPVEWRVDPIKIACLLRCADAGHFYNDRAPDLLRALLKRSGISANHWKAQNWITRLDADQSDMEGEAIVFTSSRDFGPEDRDAWWVASDAVELLNKEIQSSNALLKEKSIASSPQFKIKRVTGAESPEVLKNFITTTGWNPFPINLHVSNIENLVESLGGENLYGNSEHVDNLEVVIREIIQNSTDAIHARESINEDGYFPELRIVVRAEMEGDEERMWLDFIDNGVGMSRRVLTGPFIDFGTSFWASTLLHSEFPGLRSSSFRPIGKYGIGFFSVFMVADEVIVTTKPYTGGAESALRMTFTNGSKFRPLLQNGPFSDMPISSSTVVSVKLKNRYKLFVENVEIKRNVQDVPNISTKLSEYILSIASGITIPIVLKQNGTESSLFRGHPIADVNLTVDWLSSISFANGDVNSSDLLKYIEDAADRAELIEEDGRILGFAALSSEYSFSHSCLSAKTVGGLCNSVHSRGGTPFIGFMETYSKSAKRDVGSYVASESVLRKWCKSQLEKLVNRGLNLGHRVFLPYYLADFKTDPIEIAAIGLSEPNVPKGRKTSQTWLSADECAGLLLSCDIGVFTMVGSKWAESVDEFTSDKAIVTPAKNGSFSSITIIDGVPENDFGFADCIHRSAVRRGLNPSWREESTHYRGRFGTSLTLWVCSVPK